MKQKPYKFMIQAKIAVYRKNIDLFLLLFIPLLMFGCSALDQKRHQKPNLLIIHTDEHNFRTLGCYRELLSGVFI